MSPPEAAVPRLWTPQGFRGDVWRHADDAATLAVGDHVILPLEAFLALDAKTRLNARDRLGVLLLPGDPVEALSEHLGALALIALAFPAFNDGRSFSKAELLRSRHGFAGPLRATGEVLIDQIPHMLRLGFTEFEVSDATALARLAEGRTGGLGRFYQPAGEPSEATERYSWRRVAGA